MFIKKIKNNINPLISNILITNKVPKFNLFTKAFYPNKNFSLIKINNQNNKNLKI